ncbi:hypothetical protein BDB00DRAFT_787995 [Zychaea mexicana]|uniref:uncharacterized protein n=1 Tax=Zychaea mexicana TaxID=64656 RepID=UPI0022FDD146|nr:uncharacterized protein BDB00DRAFT_787995 [Zychaea mexicana]KAI9493305.1 hypothetical protein BDB00DRAFT_787995 [Zychaea mexicana]
MTDNLPEHEHDINFINQIVDANCVIAQYYCNSNQQHNYQYRAPQQEAAQAHQKVESKHTTQLPLPSQEQPSSQELKQSINWSDHRYDCHHDAENTNRNYCDKKNQMNGNSQNYCTETLTATITTAITNTSSSTEAHHPQQQN